MYEIAKRSRMAIAEHVFVEHLSIKVHNVLAGCDGINLGLRDRGRKLCCQWDMWHPREDSCVPRKVWRVARIVRVISSEGQIGWDSLNSLCLKTLPYENVSA